MAEEQAERHAEQLGESPQIGDRGHATGRARPGSASRPSGRAAAPISASVRPRALRSARMSRASSWSPIGGFAAAVMRLVQDGMDVIGHYR